MKNGSTLTTSNLSGGIVIAEAFWTMSSSIPAQSRVCKSRYESRGASHAEEVISCGCELRLDELQRHAICLAETGEIASRGPEKVDGAD
jgi:hypothetical protein